MSLVSAQSVIRNWNPSNTLYFFALTQNSLGQTGRTVLQVFQHQMHLLWTLFLNSLTLVCLRIWPSFSLCCGQYGGIEIKPFLGILLFRLPSFGTLQNDPNWIILMLDTSSPLPFPLSVPIGLLPLLVFQDKR